MLKISKNLKDFLDRRGKKYLDVPNPNYEELYYYANCDELDGILSASSIGELTDTLIYLNLNPLKSGTMTYIPSYFMCLSSEPELEIPEGVKAIYPEAFYHSEIEKVVIPRSIEQINGEAFKHCDQLTQVIYLGTKEEWLNTEIRDDAFTDCSKLEKIETLDGFIYL